MDTCRYEEVDATFHDKPQERKTWQPFLKQLLVCSCLWTTYFVTGLSLGAPTVVIPQMRRANGTAVSDEMASWLSSALSYSTMPWVIILPTLSHYFGRKIPFYFAISTSVVSFFIFYFAHTPIQFLISQIIQGILFGSNLTISVIIIAEYTTPTYRGLFLTIKSASLWWGVWVSNAIGTFWKWNYIGLFGLVCSCFYVTVFIWPESPHWLATKGKFRKCTKAHQWLKGVDEKSNDELKQLIDSQKYIQENSRQNMTMKEKFESVCRIVTLKEFYMPILLSFLVMAQHNASGKIVCSVYAIELIKKITDSESTAYIGMLILDGVSVVGNYVGSILSKFLTRRLLLIGSSILGIIFLFILSLYIWLVEQDILTENKIVSISILAAFFISMCCGPAIISTSIYAELVPLRFKSSSVSIIILFHFLTMGTIIKLGPLVFKTFNLYGTFSLYGFISAILTYLLYKYLPETKDKTLLEIEEYFKDKKSSHDKINVKKGEESIDLMRS